MTKKIWVLISCLVTTIQAAPIVRRDFFKDIAGETENEFRINYGWYQGKLMPQSKQVPRGFCHRSLIWASDPWKLGSMPVDLLGWIQKHPRRAAIFQGTVTFQSLRDIDKKIGANITPLTSKAQFTIIFHDPDNPNATDVRYLMAQPENKHAGFQVASTLFGLLEGGIINWNKKIEDMLYAAAQGEEVSIATAPATIFRKYFMNYTEKWGAFPYLLYYLRDKAPVKWHGGKPEVSVESVKSYCYEPGDIKKVSIGLHDQVVVSLGGAVNPFKKPEPSDEQYELDIVVDSTTGKVDTTKMQIVNLVFTSAYSLRGFERSDPASASNPNVVAFAKMLLDASYEATLKALYLTGQPKIYLTLMGASAFLNNITWLLQALNRPEIIDFIKRAGLQVFLIYRPEPGKAHLKVNPRNPNEDKLFLMGMIEMADAINETNLKNDPAIAPLITNYLAVAYSANPRPNNYAQELNKKFASVSAPTVLLTQKLATLTSDLQALNKTVS